MTLEEQAVMPLAGGIAQHGYQCGMIWGAALAAGAEASRLYGAGPRAEAGAVAAAQRLVEAFRALNEHIDCIEITGIDKSSSKGKMVAHFLFKGGTVRCIHMASVYAPRAFREIGAAFAKQVAEPPQGKVSCTAKLARAMGVSEERAIMAAGFAGGIGLSGGACGALGTAIWISGLKRLERGEDKLSFSSKEGAELITRFLAATDYEFECAKIVGRKFDGIGDHADHVCRGGCANIIDALAG